MNAWIKQHYTGLSTILKACMVVAVLLLLSGCGDNNATEEDMVVSVENCWPCTLYKVIF